NAVHLAAHPHDGGELGEELQRARQVYTPAFFAAHARTGVAASDPIFVLGMPRSGSTLVEQILASHSAVAGTMELIELLAIARTLKRSAPLPESLRDLRPESSCEVGEEYLARTRPFRRTAAPHFIDKMPNNFRQIGLIHLILPNAHIVDVRRHPL